MIRDKYYFLADTHLGSPSYEASLQREKLLINFLLEVEKDAKAIYLLGDIFDFWYEYRYVVPKYYVRLLGTLAMIADKGIEIHFFTGNHDQWIRDYFQKEIGMIIHTKELEVEIEGKKFFLAHGDGLSKKDKRYLFMKWLFGSKIIRFLFATLHPRWAIAFGNAWSRSSRRSHSEYDLLDKGEEEELYKYAIEKLKHKDIDFFIFGHRHLGKEYALNNNNDKKLIILNSWIGDNGYAVWDKERLELKKP